MTNNQSTYVQKLLEVKHHYQVLISPNRVSNDLPLAKEWEGDQNLLYEQITCVSHRMRVLYILLLAIWVTARPHLSVTSIK